jgi:hypothetical protein
MAAIDPDRESTPPSFGEDRGSYAALPDSRSGSGSASRSGPEGERPLRWPEPINSLVEIEMEMDVREFLIGGL